MCILYLHAVVPIHVLWRTCQHFCSLEECKFSIKKTRLTGFAGSYLKNNLNAVLGGGKCAWRVIKYFLKYLFYFNLYLKTEMRILFPSNSEQSLGCFLIASSFANIRLEFRHLIWIWKWSFMYHSLQVTSSTSKKSFLFFKTWEKFTLALGRLWLKTIM